MSTNDPISAAYRDIQYEDDLNDAIWRDSPAVQRDIQMPESLRPAPGAESSLFYGAQQAMIEPLQGITDEDTVLPWVPDILGARWKERDSLLIVGSAYAGFIEEYTPRPNVMTLATYLQSQNWQEFQQQFLSFVVAGDRPYYKPVAQLAQVAGGTTHIALFDLCRASFVRRGTWLPPKKVNGKLTRGDSSDAKAVHAGAQWFTRYIEARQPAEWTWQRIVRSQSSNIAALGYIAEHGLLRLFAQRRMTICLYADESLSQPIKLPTYSNGQWVKHYADVNRKIGWWLEGERWWVVSGEVDGQNRTWRLLPVYHPAYLNKYDPAYLKTSPLLDAMMKAQ